MSKQVEFKNDVDRSVQRIKVTAIIADGKEFPIDPVICEGSVSLKCEMLDVVKFEPHDAVEVSEAHAHIHLDNVTGGDYTGGAYSHLIGKFCKYIGADLNMYGRYFKIVSAFFQHRVVEGALVTPDGIAVVVEGKEGVFYYGTFDLSNPRDTNPDEPVEVKIPFDVSRLNDAIRYETRDGREVKCVVVNDVEAFYPVTGFLNGDPSAWTKKGYYATDDTERPQDLFMVVKEARND